MSSDRLTAHADDLCRRARPAARLVAVAPAAQRRQAILAGADALLADRADILAANAADLAQAEREGLSPAMIDRLRLDGGRLDAVVADLRAIAGLPDPVGRVLESLMIAKGIRADKVAVPIGVVACIYESRPNVTADVAGLCLMSGNACVLRGGKESAASSMAMVAALRRGLIQAELPADAVQLVMESDRSLIPLLLSRDDAIDVVVPRGGEALIKAVVACSKVPVIKHDKGVCSLYVHAAADLDMAEALILNAKCQRPGVCNAVEQLLVDESIAAVALPRLGAALTAAGVTLHAGAGALPFLPMAVVAQSADIGREWLSLDLTVMTVAGLDDAIRWTNTVGSGHSDAIVTADLAAAERYLREVDSACVYHNASTRFTDGGQFGFGAEVGISTNRIHARGPMGLRELCTYKYICRGTGQVRG